MLADGVTIQAWVSHFIIAPPLIVTKEEIDYGIATLDQHLAIADVSIEADVNSNTVPYTTSVTSDS